MSVYSGRSKGKMAKKRYAVCGISGRALGMFISSIINDFKDVAEVVGLLDIDTLRFEYAKERFPELKDVPCYLPAEFDKMLNETKPDALLVVCKDCHHVDYLLKGLENDLDVICEKPLCTNTEDVVKVIQAEKKSKGKVIATFNYRYAPIHRKLREMLIQKKVGRITHVDLNWYIDIRHGASYFNRWNRMRENSGSLSIHKASHHFDLVNWWIDGTPEIVHAFGALNHFGPNGVFNPSKKDGRRCLTCDEKANCPYVNRWVSRTNQQAAATETHMSELLGVERKYSHDLYVPDRCIFDSEINIHDTLIANVRYTNGVLLNYSANFSTPWEGYRLAINGTHGRIECEEWGGVGHESFPMPGTGKRSLDYYPIFGSKETHWVQDGVGGHGGGDSVIKEDIFLGVDPNRSYKILADSHDALRSIAIGDAVWNSIKGEKIIDLRKEIPEDIYGEIKADFE